jgi:hypothetical protein
LVVEKQQAGPGRSPAGKFRIGQSGRGFNGWRSALADPRLEGLAVRAGVALVVAWAAVEQGAFAVADRGSLGIAVWWALGLFVLVGGLAVTCLGRPAVVVGALLAGLAALAAFSMLWTPDREQAYDDATRVALYVGVFVLVALAARAGSARSWAEGLALGILVVGGLALVGRLFPGTFHQSAALARLFPEAARRLNYPLDYWNGLAALFALGVPLLLASAVSARTPIARGLALAPLPGIVGAI